MQTKGMNVKMVMKWCSLFGSEFQIDQTRVVLEFCLHCIVLVNSVEFSNDRRDENEKKNFLIFAFDVYTKTEMTKELNDLIQQCSRVDLIEHFKKSA